MYRCTETGQCFGENLDGLDGNLLLNRNLDEELPNRGSFDAALLFCIQYHLAS